jgi:hypothetical protein
MQWKVVGTVVVVLALGGAGCGGSGGSAPKADFAKQVTTICKQRSLSVVALVKRNPGNARGFMTEALPVAAKSLDDLNALKPPAEKQATYARFLVTQRQQIDAVKSALAQHGSPGRIEGSTGAQLHERERIERTLGVTGCS